MNGIHYGGPSWTANDLNEVRAVVSILKRERERERETGKNGRDSSIQNAVKCLQMIQSDQGDLNLDRPFQELSSEACNWIVASLMEFNHH